jgi:hypothetical protein
MMPIFEPHQAKLTACAITDQAAREAGIGSLPATAVARLLGQRVHGDALFIPYRDSDGLPISGADGVAIARYRVFDMRTDDERGGGKAQRYLSRGGKGNSALYLPHGLAALLDAPCPFLIITEGELKALSATSHHLACAALAGVAMWRADDAPADAPDTVRADIIAIARRARRVIVLADSDARENERVRDEMTAFADALRKQAEVVVVYAEVPCHAAKATPRPVGRPKKGEPDPLPVVKEGKRGLDDWIAQNRHDVAPILRFFHKRMAAEIERLKIVGGGGFLALGYNEGGSVVWAIPRNSIVTVPASAVTNSGVLMEICGAAWCDAAYPGTPGRNGKVNTDFTAIARNIIDQCNLKGVFRDDNVRGAGVWQSDDSDDVIVVNSGLKLWRSDGRHQPRIDGTIYAAYDDLGLDHHHPQATIRDAEEVYEAFTSWRFKRDTDALLMFGWLAHAFLIGAWDWRAHGCRVF